MWRRAVLCVAGLAGIALCAVRAEETTHVAIPEAPAGSYVCYVDDDPSTTHAAAGRVLRLLEMLGVHRPTQPNQPLAQAEIDMGPPPPLITETGPRETAAAVAFQDGGHTSQDGAHALQDGAHTAPLAAASPHFFMSKRAPASSWPISNDLREPAKLTALYQARGSRETREQGVAAAANPSDPAPNPARTIASPARPLSPIVCPGGMTSSRRTIQLAADKTKATEAPGAQLPAASEVPATTRATAATPAAATSPAAAAATPPATATRAPANFYPHPLSAKSMASLPPLPPLRTDSVSSRPPASGTNASSMGIASSQPVPGPAPSVRNANAKPDACIYSASETHGTAPLSADSDGLCFEPRSVDAVLEPRPVSVAKMPLHARHGADAGPAKISANVEFTRLAMPSLKRRSVLPSAPELRLQRVAASRRKSSSSWSGTPRWATLAQLPNTLRDLPKAPAADLPRQIALHSPPKSAPASPTLPALQSQPQLQPQLPPKLRPLEPAQSETLTAAPEPALVHVAVRESRLLRTSDNVVRVVSEHDGVCDVLVFNPREIAVIGRQQGTVKVEFWYDGQGTRRVSYLVAVGDGRNPEMQLEVDDRKIERLVAYLFPASRVELVRDQDRLIVRGSAVSRRQAVEIISTVRRSQLIPVADEIVVQPEAK